MRAIGNGFLSSEPKPSDETTPEMIPPKNFTPKRGVRTGVLNLYFCWAAYICQPFHASRNMRLKDNLVALHFKYDQARRRFVERAQNEVAVVPDFHKRILFSDEAHFWLNGYVNKQNCRIWSEANPQVYVETPLHPEKLTVWCALWAGGILLQKR
ncbi:hypothetical protein TNCV_4367201 [Trichonephila clavipes]|nr:hypothetical protein TNCV_4367201 [Trichonephila clavipes]